MDGAGIRGFHLILDIVFCLYSDLDSQFAAPSEVWLGGLEKFGAVWFGVEIS